MSPKEIIGNHVFLSGYTTIPIIRAELKSIVANKDFKGSDTLNCRLAIARHHHAWRILNIEYYKNTWSKEDVVLLFTGSLEKGETLLSHRGRTKRYMSLDYIEKEFNKLMLPDTGNMTIEIIRDPMAYLISLANENTESL